MQPVSRVRKNGSYAPLKNSGQAVRALVIISAMGCSCINF